MPEPAGAAPHSEPTLTRLAVYAGACAALIGAMALLGWIAGIEPLKRFSPRMVAVNPVVGCCLILLGAATGLHVRERPAAARACAALVAAVGLAKLVDFTGLHLPVDRLLFPGQLDQPAGALPNRMAANTAACLALLGMALALAGTGGRPARLAVRVLTVAALVIATVTLVGYVFAIDRLTAVGQSIPMALNTGVALLAAAIGALALGRGTMLEKIACDSGLAGSMARRVLPIAILSPIVIGVARQWGERSGQVELEVGIALAVVANAAINSLLLMVSIVALYRSDAARKEREDALRRSEHFNRKINQASPDCVTLLDAQGQVLFANDATLRAFGIEAMAELVGRPWGERFDQRGRANAEAAIAAARDGRVGRLTTTLPGPDGGPWWYESLVSRLEDSDSGPIAFVVMSRDITRQKAIEDQVRWAATHDALTRLPNRAFFQQRLEEVFTAQGPGQANAALLILDVDDFKLVNDTLGHDAGDALLQTVANRLRTSVRRQDFVARLGGDEFAIILSGIRTHAALNAAARKLVEAMKQPWLYDDRLCDCRVSIGACIAASRAEHSSELLKKADIALYAAKLQAGARIAVYQPEMRAQLQKRASELALARDALLHDMVRPSYQPKVEMKSGRLTGFEALLRWRHPTRGIQKPGLIGAAFDDVELAAKLTDRMLSCMLADMRGWLDAGLDFGHVAVNAAAADFKQQDFAERLLDRLERAGVPPALLQVEITETVFLGRGAEYVERALKQLSAAGIRIALDDFGTGYASLSHLKQFPVDVVKIDRSFLRDITDPHNAAIIRTVVSLGQSLELDVVAEGVETRAQEAYLLSEGCLLGQGYRYGKAVPAGRVPALCARGRGGVALAA